LSQVLTEAADAGVAAAAAPRARTAAAADERMAVRKRRTCVTGLFRVGSGESEGWCPAARGGQARGWPLPRTAESVAGLYQPVPIWVRVSPLKSGPE
jgi:hypothetical protein